MNQEIKIKEIEPMLVATYRYKGKYTDCGKYFSKIFKEAKFKAKGTPFLLCFDNEYKEDGADIEVCVPITEKLEVRKYFFA